MYDYLSRPFTTCITKHVQQGIENEEQLAKGFYEGWSEAWRKSARPVYWRSYWTEAIIRYFS